MSDLILYIVKQLVTNPEAVLVDEQKDGGEVNLTLTVAPEDMGLIIGKGGNTIKALRKILIIKAMADNVRVSLQLAEPEGGRPEKSEQSEKSDKQLLSPSLPSDEGQSDESEKSAEPEKVAEQAEESTEAEKLAEEHADAVAEQD